MTKRCFKCKRIKPLSEFYKHSEMADGHLNKCKKCTKRDMRNRYYNPLFRQKIIEYERERFKNPERRARLLIYQRRRRVNHPGKNLARQKVQQAIRAGRL